MLKDETLPKILFWHQRLVTGLFLLMLGVAALIALTLALRYEPSHLALWGLLYIVTLVFAIDYRGARRRNRFFRSWIHLGVLLSLLALLWALHTLHAPPGHIALGDSWRPRPDLPAHLHARALLSAGALLLLLDLPLHLILRRRHVRAQRLASASRPAVASPPPSRE